MRPGLFGGFAQREEDVAFNRLFAGVTGGSDWCCAGWLPPKDNQHVLIPYQLPEPLGGAL